MTSRRDKMPEKKKDPGICPIFHAALLIAGLRKAGDEGASGKCLGKECEAWSKFNTACGLKFAK